MWRGWIRRSFLIFFPGTIAGKNISALQLTVQIHSTIGRNLSLSFFQFTITDLQSIFQSRKLPELTIGNIQKAAEEKLYQLLTEGIPAMQKVAAVYISQSIKQMRVTKLPNIRLGVSLSAGLLNLDLDVEGMDQAQLFDILSRYDRRKKYFRPSADCPDT